MGGLASKINGRKGGRPIGTKSWKTVEKEKLREHYIQTLSEHFDELTHIHLESAKDPENKDERRYALDQLLGKAKESVEVDIKGNLKVDV